MMNEQHIKILARGQHLNKATLISALLSLGLWDSLSIVDREAWCERAEVLDTAGGRQLFETLQRIGMFPEVSR